MIEVCKIMHGVEEVAGSHFPRSLKILGALLDVVVKAFPGALSAVLFTFIAVMHL